jgi:hypothetical protein
VASTLRALLLLNRPSRPPPRRPPPHSRLRRSRNPLGRGAG